MTEQPKPTQPAQPTPSDESVQTAKAKLRQVLDDVAAGRLSPVEASARLADTDGQFPDTDPNPNPDPNPDPDADTGTGTGPPIAGRTNAGPTTRSTTTATPDAKPGKNRGPGQGDVWAEVSDQPGGQRATGFTPAGSPPDLATARRVVIRAVGRRVRVIGEPSVATVSVDGAHVVRRDGTTITVTSEGELGASLDGFTLMRSRSFEDVRDSLLGFGRELAVRVNPSLEVELEVTAGGVSVERVPKLTHVRVTAGSAKVVDAEGPLDLLVQAGSAKVAIRPTNGSSRLRVESGSLDVRVGRGSDVRVRSDAQLGRVSWQGSSHQGSADEVTIGSGSATLTLEVVMGSAQVRTD